MALKTTQLGVFYWDDAIPLAAVLEEDGTIDGNAFLASWRGLAQEASQRLDVTISDIEAAKAKLGAARLFVLAHRPVGFLGGGEPVHQWRWTRGAPAVAPWLQVCSLRSEHPDTVPTSASAT